LFGTAIRVAIERLKEGRNIDAGKRGNGERNGAGAGHEIGEQIAAERERFTGERELETRSVASLAASTTLAVALRFRLRASRR